MNTTREFNAEDWSGDTITVDYDETERSFEMYGYDFTVTHYTEVFRGEGFVQLLGEGWDDALCTIYCAAEDSLESLIIKAARYVRNYV
ncbi:MAG: hypothetical protein QNI96_05220 [Woeseiaceae bacterium]|nr:hypothetical protein [Woeseiaceae bacterium]